MASRDEIRIAMQSALKWVVVGSGPQPRDEADMRAIIEWIDQAVDAMLIDPDCRDAAMLGALREGLFTITSIDGRGPVFQLTDYGRARVDSMPHDPQWLSRDGVS